MAQDVPRPLPGGEAIHLQGCQNVSVYLVDSAASANHTNSTRGVARCVSVLSLLVFLLLIQELKFAFKLERRFFATVQFFH